MSDFWNQQFETMPWGDLHSYWLDKFNHLLAYVKANSTFYKKYLEKINAVSSFDDLTSVPVMTKAEIREAQLVGDRAMPLGTIQTAKTEDIVQMCGG